MGCPLMLRRRQVVPMVEHLYQDREQPIERWISGVIERLATLPGGERVGALVPEIMADPAGGRGLAACARLASAAAERRQWKSLVVHLEAAIRLRLVPEVVVGRVTAAGVVLTRAWGQPRAALVDDPGRAVWRGLSDGLLSLVEGAPGEGERWFEVFENAAHHRPLRALSRREGEVLSRCARGRSNKEIAYAMGLGFSSISQLLATASLKLGLTSVRAAVRVVASLRGFAHSTQGVERLSAAEGEVLALLSQGLSNAAIAQERGVSGRTVANQIASIMKKTGASSRRVLLFRHLAGQRTK
jgi:DNA-binding CsgD family transcriptional regulator